MMRSPIANIKDAVITDYFRAPKCEQCSGNRGIELQLNAGEPIFAVADGVISFHGEVNRTKYLVLLTTNYRRITYGKIALSTVRVGERVKSGQQIAVSGPNLYFGIREFSGGVAQYVDPLIYLANVVTNKTGAVLISDMAESLGTRNLLNLRC